MRHCFTRWARSAPLAALLLVGALAVAPNTASATSCAVWSEGKTYTAGMVVYYQAQTYTALQTHTACVGCGWNPQATPSLWQAGGTCGGTPPPTPTPTVTPTPTPTVTPTPTPTPTPTTTGCYPAWTSTTAYTGGQRVTHKNITYEAKWWTQGEDPSLSGQWGVWRNLGYCDPPPTPTPTPVPTQADVNVTGKCPGDAPFPVWSEGQNYALNQAIAPRSGSFQIAAASGGPSGKFTGIFVTAQAHRSTATLEPKVVNGTPAYDRAYWKLGAVLPRPCPTPRPTPTPTPAPG